MNFGRQDGLERRWVIVGNQSGRWFRRYNVSREVGCIKQQRLIELAQVLRQLYGGYDWCVRRKVDWWLDDSTGDNEVDVSSRLSKHRRHLLRAHPTHVDFTDLQQVVSTVQPAILYSRRIEQPIRILKWLQQQ